MAAGDIHRNERAQDINISAEEGKRLPLNFLMVKAMHDRELLLSTGRGKRKTRDGRRLGARDRRILQRSAHYARFAAASYDGLTDTMKVLADAGVVPPPELFSERYEGEGRGAAVSFFFFVLSTTGKGSLLTQSDRQCVLSSTKAASSTQHQVEGRCEPCAE